MKQGTRVKVIVAPLLGVIKPGDTGEVEGGIELAPDPIMYPERTTPMLLVNFGEKGRAAFYPGEVKEI